jgi:DHA2 family multidrug resistance protein-like MFS transporter
VLFVRRQFRLADPMLDLRLFRVPTFLSSLAINFLTIFVAVGYFLFVAQYLQLVLGLSPLEAGLWSVPSAIGFIVGSNAAPRIVRYVRPAWLMGAGLALAAVGMGILTQVGVHDGLAIVVAASVIISLGLAPVFGLTTELIVGSAPPEQAGAASGISETGIELGGALGISILGSIGVVIYRREITTELPSGVPGGIVDVARDTLGGAVGAAAQLPGELGASLLAVARGAFVDGMQVAAAICAVLAVGVAILAVTTLRGVRPPGAAAADPPVSATTTQHPTSTSGSRQTQSPAPGI